MTHALAATGAINRAVARLDAWLETMRGPGGYGGPVAHWWQQSLLYTGPGLDWRYEGIIDGYVTLWEGTGEQRWLEKARRAGDDLVAGQLADGHYAASAFEINPATAGTPHEAACDAALLRLALALRTTADPSWSRYAASAERNLRAFYIDQLWDAEMQAVRDSPQGATFVPNKAATACEALFLLADVSGDACWAERYALPTLARLLAHQVRGGELDGAIAQNSFGRRMVEKYFPIYIARCVPALLRAFHWTGHERYLAAALAAMRFVVRWIDADGALPTVVYPRRRVSRTPTWVAPLADVLRAVDALRPYGFDARLEALEQRLLAGQDASGGIQTARGFAAQAGRCRSALPDVRDVLHVVGWCDKALRYLAAHVRGALPDATSAPFEAACGFQGQTLRLLETAEALEVSGPQGVCYRWRKGAAWPEVAAPAFWLR